MKKVILILSIMFIFPIYADAQTTTEVVKFVRCVDGDTAVFHVNGQEKKFRFLAIDTPETVHPTKDVELYGKDASEYTCNKLSDAEQIMVEYEESNKVDKYNRYLGWIWVNGSLLQKELVSIGYAEVAYIYGDYKYTNSLCLVQQKAKESMLGMWDGNRQEGYCSTVDLTNATDIIDYSKIDNASIPDDLNEDKLKDAQEKLESTRDFLEKLSEKLPSYEQTENFFNKCLFYLALGIGVLTLFKGTQKKE